MKACWKNALLVVACVLLGGVLMPLAAQSQAPSHKHYEEPEQMAAAPNGQLAPRLQNLGTHTFAVSCKNAQAKKFFSQGVNLAYGFNHAEAARSFREVARLEPNCAMAYWGQSWVMGPNINAPMDPSTEAQAKELAQKAVSLKAGASPRERAYIDALAKRYSGNAVERKVRDRAFADAMAEVAKKFPADLDAATIYAEALMDLRPWNYWQPDGSRYAETPDIISTLEMVLAKNPKHPGAAHLYIHATEDTDTPERAEAAADMLLKAMPGAGHMVHMPSHTFFRVGRYADATKSNEMAVAADEDYITQCRAQGLYPMGYYPHNIHFLWFSATMEGRSALAIESARKTASKATDEAMIQVSILQAFRVAPYYALVRFGKWQEMLNEPAPPAGAPYVEGVWRYARGVALLNASRLDEAQKELERLTAISKDASLDKLQISFSVNKPTHILSIAREVLAGELAAKRGDTDRALLHLEAAVRLEDILIYTEPWDWHYPVRQSLGAVLLQAGRPLEAEAVYWKDLARNRENGWSLFGLAQALRAQGKNEEAVLAELRLQKAWAKSDVKLAASRF